LFLILGELPFAPTNVPYRLICGCKGTPFIFTSKIFIHFFFEDFFSYL